MKNIKCVSVETYSPLSRVGIVVRAGPRYEAPEDQGVSHCLRHSGMLVSSSVQIRIVCAPKIAFISLPINLNMCFGCSKEPSH